MPAKHDAGYVARVFQGALQAGGTKSSGLHAPSTTALSSRPTFSLTTASTLQPGRLVQEDLQNLDRFDDNASQATSVDYSFNPGEQSSGLNVVQLQGLTKENEPFECPYCFGIIQATRQRSWRKHVFSDLRAYACIFQDCDAGLFEERTVWMIHELEHHRRQWECQRCKEKVFESKQTLLDHIHSTHKDSSLSGDLLSQVAEVSS